MRRIRCPRCQAITYEDHITYPICHRCHENLQKCRYCRSFPDKFGRCRFLPEWSLGGGDEIIECEHRLSSLLTHTSSESSYNRPLHAVVLLAIIVCSIMVLLVAVLPMLNVPVAEEREHSVSLRGLTPSRDVIVGKTFVVALVIMNKSDRHAEDIRVRIDGSAFRNCRLENITPRPHRMYILNTAHHYLFLELKPGQQMHTKFQLRGLKPGKTTFHVTVFTGEGRQLGSLKQDILIAEGNTPRGESSARKTMAGRVSYGS